MQLHPIRTIARITTVAVMLGIVSISMMTPANAARVKTIVINDVSLVEGNGGSSSLVFTVSWTGSKGGAAPSASYATANATALAGSDYTAKSGTVTLTNGGCRCGTISISVSGDNLFEGTETFAINLSNANNATIGDPQGVGTIYDNEGPPALIVTDTSAAESDGAMGFTVLLTSGSVSPVTVDYATASGTATATDDYTTTSGTLTFASGQTSKSVAVPVVQDALAEDTETFTVSLSNASGAPVTAAQGIGSITDDDADPSVSVSNVSVAEGAAGTTSATFTVSLSAAAGREVAVDAATSDTTAVAGTDYTSASSTVTFAAGETSKSFVVTVAGDLVFEGDETFAVTLAAPVNADLGDANGVGTITDDDLSPALSVDDVTVVEGAGGTTIATFTVSLSNPSASLSSAVWSTSDGSATAGTDYAAGTGTVSFAVGQTTRTVEVTVQGDTLDEADETFSVALANPLGSSIADDTGVATIDDDDKTVTGLTAKVKKATRSLKVSGLIESAASGMKVAVTLQRKKGAKYVKVSSVSASVKSLMDRDADGLTDGSYVATLKRPARGAYRVLVKYVGSADYLASSKTVALRI
ncbi:MAG TPA: Calx-beta domain-containing protein [Actinomycetota bacterium]